MHTMLFDSWKLWAGWEEYYRKSMKNKTENILKIISLAELVTINKT